jgi:hypothetical protein
MSAECKRLSTGEFAGPSCSCQPGACALSPYGSITKGPRREATCQCCHRNDAPQGETVCTSCRGYAVRLTKAEARLLQKLLTMQLDYPELEPEHQALYEKLEAVL